MTAEILINELIHNVEASGNRLLERRLADLAVWFYKGKTSIAQDNLAKQLEFLSRAFWIMLEVQALLLARLHSTEGRSESLWLPSGVNVNGSLQRTEQ